MKNFAQVKRLTGFAQLLFIAAFFIMISAGSSHAAGTVAGTVISNQAYADYKDSNGNAMTRVFSNTVTTIVKQVAAVEFVPASIQNTGGNGSEVAFLCQIFNRGNGNDNFTFKPTVTSGWTPTSIKFYYENHAVPGNNHHTYDPGVEVLINPDANGFYHTSGIMSTLPEDDFDLYLVVTVPASGTAANGSSSLITVTATSDFNNTVSASGTYTTLVESASIVSKLTTAPENPAPGDTITYTITLTNNGSSAGSAVKITDALPAGVTYVPGSITIGGVSKTDASDADGSDYNVTTPNAATISAGTINPGQTVIITLKGTINANVASGTALTNQATVAYTAGATPITTNTNGNTIFVAAINSVSLSTLTTSKNANPGDLVVYPFTAANNSNAADRINFSYTSSTGLTFDIWVDSDGNGIPGTGGDYKLADTNGDGKIDTGILDAGASISLLAATTTQAGTPNGTTDATTITGSSATTPAVKSQITVNTSMTSPLLSMVKEVSPSGSQAPGAELTYTVTVTNNGSGLATNVIITDPIPTNTTYKPGTIKTGSALANLNARTDADDGDGAKYDSGSKSVVVGTSSTTLGAGGILVVQFKAVIN
jgi:uncharacterized repeat protein (TIGR01451 family)